MHNSYPSFPNHITNDQVINSVRIMLPENDIQAEYMTATWGSVEECIAMQLAAKVEDVRSVIGVIKLRHEQADAGRQGREDMVPVYNYMKNFNPSILMHYGVIANCTALSDTRVIVALTLLELEDKVIRYPKGEYCRK